MKYQTEYAIQTQDVNKTYKNGIQALKGLNMKVKAGEIYSLLGENGAGKSTLIRILTAFLKPSAGKIRVLGKDICADSNYIRSKIACVSQQITIDTHLSMQENMMFQARLYRVSKREAENRIKKLIKEFDLEPYVDYPIASYSGGIKRRLDIAVNMMSNPEILFLDEPTVGMDIQSRKVMWEMIRKIRDEFGITVFFTTHYLEEADELSDTICIMRNGRDVIEGNPFELKEYLRQDVVKITLFSKDYFVRLKERLMNEYGKENVKSENVVLIITAENVMDTFHGLVTYLSDNQIPFCGIEIVQPTLEDVFLKLTKKETMV